MGPNIRISEGAMLSAGLYSKLGLQAALILFFLVVRSVSSSGQSATYGIPELVPQTGHTGYVTALAFSPDGR